MPGGDRTGPAGMGPLTGRGLGPCGDGARAAYGYGRGWGRGFGRFGGGYGRGRGFGGGFAGRGWGYLPFRTGQDAIDTASYEENEKDFLDREINYLKSELESMEKRRSTLKDE